MSTYVYLRSEPELYTVGFYNSEGKWHPESDHATRDEAAARVVALNGGPNRDDATVAVIRDSVAALYMVREWMDDSKFRKCPVPKHIASKVRLALAGAGVRP